MEKEGDMMEATLEKILGKPSDFKLCKSCKAINWYENEECRECHKKRFNWNVKLIEKWVDYEFKFWIETEGYSENEADNILYDI